VEKLRREVDAVTENIVPAFEVNSNVCDVLIALWRPAVGTGHGFVFNFDESA
jgi:hypothetical protein